MNNLNTLGLLALALLILIKDVVVPLVKRMNHNRANPISLDRLYQEFKDFKETQGKWNEKVEKRIEKIEEKS
jgi:hypothetical protein